MQVQSEVQVGRILELNLGANFCHSVESRTLWCDVDNLRSTGCSGYCFQIDMY
jgi:hypothetical protein